MIRRLALASTGFARDGFYPEIVKMQAQVSGAMAGAMKDTPCTSPTWRSRPHRATFRAC
jgi:hypothetical protein